MGKGKQKGVHLDRYVLNCINRVATLGKKNSTHVCDTSLAYLYSYY